VKLGILGGTFDPVHRGHLLIAEEARSELGISEIIMVPSGQPPFKSADPVTPPKHRLEMLRLAITGLEHFWVSSVEIERPGTSYTVDTIAEFQEKFRDEGELFFILGWDSLSQLAGWREPSRLISMCQLVAVARPDCTRPDLEKIEASVPGITKRVLWLDKPQIDISASSIRGKVARGEAIDHLVPKLVAEYIREHGLYTKKREV
jgi:nicotinate-nucleotide adenylyltransferase